MATRSDQEKAFNAAFRAKLDHLLGEHGDNVVLAKMVGTNKVRVTKWTRGPEMPRLFMFRKICEALNVSMDWITDAARAPEDRAPAFVEPTGRPLTEDQKFLLRKADELGIDGALAAVTDAIHLRNNPPAAEVPHHGEMLADRKKRLNRG